MTRAMPATGRVPLSMWRSMVRGWRMWLPVVVVNAAVQAVLVAGDPVPTTSVTFAALVVVSSAAVVLTVAALTAAAQQAAAGGRWWTAPPRLRLVGWTLGIAVLVGAVAVAVPWVTPPLLVLGAAPLAAVAAGRHARDGWAPWRQAPIRTTLTTVALAGLAMLSWPVALVLGFFVTGTAGAAATWLWFGVVAALVSTVWATAVRRWSASVT